jgi:AmpE protein
MNFLLILIAAVVEFTVVSFAGMRSKRWSSDWSAWINQVAGRYAWWPGAVGAAITLLVPVLGVALLFAMLGAWSEFLANLGGLFILLLMLGPTDLNADIETHRRNIDVMGTDDASAVDPEFLVRAGGFDLGEATGDDDFDRNRGELASLALAADAAWYQPLFWFFIFGPVGAVLYRICANLRGATDVNTEVLAMIAQVRELLEWLPGRITVLAMGVAGTLVPVLETARTVGLLRWSVTEELVARASLAAVDYGRIHEVTTFDPRVYRVNLMHAMIKRTLNVWLVFIAGGALLIW